MMCATINGVRLSTEKKFAPATVQFTLIQGRFSTKGAEIAHISIRFMFMAVLKADLQRYKDPGMWGWIIDRYKR